MQVIGLCRFSYPGLGGFQIEHDTLDERIAFLYAEERLEERFRFFETFTLPSIRGQLDPDFTFLVVIGDSLPDRHRKRLENLVADVPQVVIQSHPPCKHRDVMKTAINSVKTDAKSPSVQFRLDDDDAVAITFVAKLRIAAGQVAGLLEDHRHVAIDFNQGYIARPGPEGIAATPIRKPLWTAGLAIMFRPGVNATIMNFSHMSVGRKMPTLSFSSEDMMLRGHNDYNDSRQGPGIKPVRLTPLDSAGEELFETTYNIRADHVRHVFADR
ncbi:putative rhamnosyl transferase [Arenibacterium sp. CAU 1754]